MDDTDEKLRRNLVAVSSVFIASSWVDLHFVTAQAFLFGTLRLEPGSEDKLWFMAFLVLCYCFVRYFLSEGFELQMRKWRAEHDARELARIIRSVARNLTKAANNDTLGRPREVQAVGNTYIPVQPRQVHILPRQITYAERYSWRRGGYQIRFPDDVAGEFEHRYPPEQENPTDSYELSVWQGVRIQTITWMLTMSFSRGFLEAAFPALLGAVAIAIGYLRIFFPELAPLFLKGFVT